MTEQKNELDFLKNSFAGAGFSNSEEKPKSKVYEIFKGIVGDGGVITRKRTLGQARLFEGSNTYHVFIKSLLGERFFLLPENRNPQKHEYVILTREPSLVLEKKYYWNSVGEGKILMGQNQGLMKLDWDFFSTDEVYMKLEPTLERASQNRTVDNEQNQRGEYV